VRPRHPQADAAAQEAHKQNFADLVAAAIPPTARDKPIELWWQDEARVGHQGALTRIWAERDSRPTCTTRSALPMGLTLWRRMSGTRRRARAAHAYLHVMNPHLQEIDTQVSQYAFTMLTLDGA